MAAVLSLYLTLTVEDGKFHIMCILPQFLKLEKVYPALNKYLRAEV